MKLKYDKCFASKLRLMLELGESGCCMQICGGSKKLKCDKKKYYFGTGFNRLNLIEHRI